MSAVGDPTPEEEPASVPATLEDALDGADLTHNGRGVPSMDDASRIARRSQMVALRLAGATYEEIAAQFGYGDKSTARRNILGALRDHEADRVVELRTTENRRMDRMQRALWPKVLAGDTRAADTVLRLMQRRARLNGLDAPIQVEVSQSVRAELDDALALFHEAIRPKEADIVDADVVEEEPGDGDA